MCNDRKAKKGVESEVVDGMRVSGVYKPVSKGGAISNGDWERSKGGQKKS